MKREDLKIMTDELREKAALLGWNKTNTLALIRSAKKYGGIEGCLSAFRQAIKEKGGEGIETDMIPTVKVYGTVKDLSMLLYLGYFDAHVIDQKEGEKIKERVKTLSDEEKVEHFQYLRVFSAMRSFSHILHESCGIYYTAAYAEARNVSEYELLTIIPSTVSRLMNMIPNGKETEALEIMDDMSRSLIKATGFGEFDVNEEEGRLYTRDIDILFDAVKKGAETANLCLRDYKTMLVSVVKWAAENNGEDFIPQTIFDDKKDIEKTNGIVLTDKRWLTSHISELQQRGEEITDEDRKRAIIEDFNSVEIYQKVVDFTYKKLDFFYEKG